MSFFKDKEWENMDWLNRAVEPYTFSLNEELAKLPSRIDITAKDIMDLLRRQQIDINMVRILANTCKAAGWSKFQIDMLENFGMNNFFELRYGKDAFLDVESETLHGEIFIIKTVESMDDAMLTQFIDRMIALLWHPVNVRNIDSANVNEVMDILGCQEARSSSSVRKKLQALTTHLHMVFKENKWNIKNIDLIVKMLQWISGYIATGSRHSLANLSKLKCMTHSGHPIYSMEEIV